MTPTERRIRWIEAIVLLAVALTLISAAILYVPGARATISVEERLARGSHGTVLVSVTASSTFAASLTFSSLIGNGTRSIPTLYYYVDPGYEVADTTPTNVYGFTQHLQEIARARGTTQPIVLLSARGLATFLSDPSTTHDLLMIASGALPTTVYGSGTNPLAAWMQGGGTLLWAGSPIGGYLGEPVAPSANPTVATTVPNGTENFLNGSLLGGTDPLLVQGSPAGSALGTDYPWTFPYLAFNSSKVMAFGGSVLGAQSGGFTNLVRIPYGNGTLVDLVAPVIDIDRFSYVIANLLFSGMVNPSYEFVSDRSVLLSAGATVTFQAVVPIPAYEYLGPSGEFCEYAVETDLFAPYASNACLALD